MRTEVRDAVQAAVTLRFTTHHQLPPNTPVPASLTDAYNDLLQAAMGAAEIALGRNNGAARNLEQFATTIASGVQMTVPAHSGMAVALQLDRPLELTAEQRQSIAKRMAVCPFVGSKTAEGALPIYGSKENPLVKIEDVVKAAGAGTLGEHVLRIFAAGNQTKMLGPTGKLDAECPPGFMSLHLLGSKGSHGGASGILHDPLDRSLGAGRRSPEAFAWLKGFANGEGRLDVEGMGKAIGSRMFEFEGQDDTIKVAGTKVAAAMGLDTLAVVGAGVEAIVDKAKDRIGRLFGIDRPNDDEPNEFVRKLTTLTGENTLIGSAGEWALLYAGWANAEGVRQKGGGLELNFDQIAPQFLEGRTPAAFDLTEKSGIDWARATAEITMHAFKEYHRLKAEKG